MTSVSQASADPLALLDDYDFDLPESSIAQRPSERRDEARLLVLDRTRGEILESGPDHRVRDLPEWLAPGDLLVLNATRVLPARIVGRKASGGAAEALLLGALPEAASGPGPAANDHRALLRSTGRTRIGLALGFGPSADVLAEVVEVGTRGEVVLRFAPGVDPYALGEAPLPPYIRRDPAAQDASAADLERYQTVYARAPGAIAAPTAGLHLTEALLQRLRREGVEVAEVVLHVGLGTFRPLDAEALASGRLHREDFELPSDTATAIARTRKRGGRVIAVGTTTARVLESRAAAGGCVTSGCGQTDLFIRPGGRGFRVVDGLLTNFHLPRSSLLMMVAAFVGREPILAAYRSAIEKGFRFYSYGDAMLILDPVDSRRNATRFDRRREEADHG